jgi:hypothetical protein
MNETTSPGGRRLRMPLIYSAVAAAVVLILGTGWAYNRNQAATAPGRGFSDSDVAKIEQSIKTEFARRSGLIVVAVKLVKESPTQLSGVAKVNVPQLGIIEKACEANLGDRGQLTWQCR